MTYPEPVQFTRAFLALGCVAMCIDITGKVCAAREGLDHIRVQLDKMCRWKVECEPLRRRGGKSGLSSGAMRDIGDIVDVVFNPVLCAPDPEARFAALATAIWATTIFLQDARNVSKLYAVGQPWFRLRQTTETLASLFRQMAPDCDVAGTACYMRAMEG